LAWIHQQLEKAAAAGCQFVPVPRRFPDGRSFIRLAGHLWELSPWMPGHADYSQHPSQAKLAAALRALATFHRATADPDAGPRRPSPGLQDRWQQLLALSPRRLASLAEAVEWASAALGRGAASEQARVAAARRILRCVPVCLELSRKVVAGAVGLTTSLQPCLRDVWHDHVLFQGQTVRGLVDFGAMRVETPVGDIARLLGSLAVDDRSAWQLGLEAYQMLQPLTPDQHRLLPAFDAANITLTGLNWIEWLFVDQRQFGDYDRVIGRMTWIAGRAEALARGDWPLAGEH
jgi:homoserine kinase type II